MYFYHILYYFCVSGKFLVAGVPSQENNCDQVACLKRENSTGMQLWKIEPVSKKMKLEISTKVENSKAC
jgi:hypothetical protein